MKNFIFPIICLFLATTAFSQEVDKFEITAYGVNGYLVEEFPKMTAAEIFAKVEKWAEYNIRNSEYSNYSKIKNEYLTYHLILSKAVYSKGFAKHFYNLEFDVEYRFKDNKLRIDVLNIELPSPYIDGPDAVLKGSSFVFSIFNKDGELRKRKETRMLKPQIEKVLNDLFQQIISELKTNPDTVNDDW
ncbi:MAG TPA: DUF4468 domain-containing protein [Flavobacteriaceae bacterium]|nr:DUF4468 domain-containing protein [Flavobacteriaceae bacterium]